jgi:hypothetical protein
MHRFTILCTATVLVLGLLGCAGEKKDEPIVRVETPQPPSTSETVAQPDDPQGLPGDWFVASNEGSVLTLEKLDDEDAWVWVDLETSVPGSDVERGISVHRKAVEDSPAGTFVGSGSVETAQHGTAVWSLGSYAGDEGEEGKNELVLHLSYPRRNALLRLRYLYPLEGGPVFDDRLTELVAIADGLSAGS